MSRAEHPVCGRKRRGDLFEHRRSLGEGGVSFAGVVVVSDYHALTVAYIDTSGAIDTAGEVAVTSSATETVRLC